MEYKEDYFDLQEKHIDTYGKTDQQGPISMIHIGDLVVDKKWKYEYGGQYLDRIERSGENKTT